MPWTGSSDLSTPVLTLVKAVRKGECRERSCGRFPRSLHKGGRYANVEVLWLCKYSPWESRKKKRERVQHVQHAWSPQSIQNPVSYTKKPNVLFMVSVEDFLDLIYILERRWPSTWFLDSGQWRKSMKPLVRNSTTEQRLFAVKWSLQRWLRVVRLLLMMLPQYKGKLSREM